MPRTPRAESTANGFKYAADVVSKRAQSILFFLTRRQPSILLEAHRAFIQITPPLSAS
jgi:hypothetical protein